MDKLNLRPAVRGLMIDPRDRVLLVRLWFDDWTGWVLPGGGREDVEDDHQALRRELAEETGVPDVFIGPQLWVRRMLLPGMGGRFDGQEETVYLVPCRAFDVRPTMSDSELQAEGLVEHRWWSVPEMELTDEVLRPAALPRLVAEILEFGAPRVPHLFED